MSVYCVGTFDGEGRFKHGEVGSIPALRATLCLKNEDSDEH